MTATAKSREPKAARKRAAGAAVTRREVAAILREAGFTRRELTRFLRMWA